MNLVLFILGVVGMTHIIVDSEISEPVHKWIKPRCPSWLAIMDCYQCAGFWCGLALGLMLLSYNPLCRCSPPAAPAASWPNSAGSCSTPWNATRKASDQCRDYRLTLAFLEASSWTSCGRSASMP